MFATIIDIPGTSQSTRLTQYQPGLDGVRALAVMAVLLFHAGAGWLPGGFLGVDTFFVLSGYLITGILTRQAANDLTAFYARRARRLLPALAAMLLITTVAAATLMKDVVVSTVADLPSALTGLSNWWFVFHHQPYFEAMGRPALFRHTWSLAVEAQFYLVWPFLVRHILRRFGLVGVRRLAIACAVLSTVALVAIGPAGGQISRAYFGTDTHAFGLFLGAVLATAPAKRRRYLNVLGPIALAGLLALFRMADETTALHYSLPLASLLAMLLVAVASNVDNPVSRFLALRPMTWLGERSYSLYVWHWPIFQATRPGIDIPAIANFTIRIALTFAIAELSYRFVEMPVRSGSWRRMLAASGWNPKIYALGLTASMAAMAVALAGGAALVRRGIETAPKAVAVLPVAPPPKPSPAKPIPASAPAPVFLLETVPAAGRPEILKLPAMLLGDSVLLGVSQWLGSELNVVKVDAVVARQATEVRKLAEHLAAEADLPPVVVINMGNNGTVDETTFRSTMTALRGCRKVVVVNARVPRKWQDEGDDLMARLVPDYPNAVLADWRAASEGHPEYLNADGVHANVEGAKAYTALVVNALVKPSTP